LEYSAELAACEELIQRDRAVSLAGPGLSHRWVETRRRELATDTHK
jgi:hypothetical protein